MNKPTNPLNDFKLALPAFIILVIGGINFVGAVAKPESESSGVQGFGSLVLLYLGCVLLIQVCRKNPDQ